MYRVVIRKSLRYADGTTALEESQEEVNHERHALNLAAKIARSEAVESVEIEELTGRFKASAVRTRTGTVHETLHSSRRRVQRETHFHSGKSNRVSKLVLLSLLALGLLGYVGSHLVTTPASRSNLGTNISRSVQIGDFQVRAIALLLYSTDLMRLHGITPRSGYQTLMVNINVSNTGQSTNCLEFDPFLVTTSANKRPLPAVRELSGPKAYSLRSAENRDGSYTFEVKNGAEPIILELVPKPAKEFVCQKGKESGSRTSFIRKLNISLEELPKPSQK